MNKTLIHIHQAHILIPSSRYTWEHVWWDTNTSVSCSKGIYQNVGVIRKAVKGCFLVFWSTYLLAWKSMSGSSSDIQGLTKIFIGFLIVINLTVVLQSCRNQVLTLVFKQGSITFQLLNSQVFLGNTCRDFSKLMLITNGLWYRAVIPCLYRKPQYQTPESFPQKKEATTLLSVKRVSWLSNSPSLQRLLSTLWNLRLWNFNLSTCS